MMSNVISQFLQKTYTIQSAEYEIAEIRVQFSFLAVGGHNSTDAKIQRLFEKSFSL